MAKAAYSKVVEHKKMAKEKLAFAKNKKEALVAIFAPIRNKDNFYKLLEGCMVLPCSFVIFSDEEPGDFSNEKSGKMAWLNLQKGNMKEAETYLNACDMAVVFEEHMSQVEKLQHEGIVIIGNEKSPLLENYHPNEETGNAFTYSGTSSWCVFMGLVRALETYRFPYDWMHIVRNVLK